MCGKSESHPVPLDNDVGVMLGFFSRSGDPVDELHGSNKVIKLKCARDGHAAAVPACELGYRPAYLRQCKRFHPDNDT